MASAVPGYAGSGSGKDAEAQKLDAVLARRADRGVGTSQVIVTYRPGTDPTAAIRGLGGRLGRRLALINGVVAEVRNNDLRRLARHPDVVSIHVDRAVGGQINHEAVAVGARSVNGELGFDGAGVGVAVIDSGITSWHDDLTYRGTSTSVQVVNGQRVAAFMDFVNGRLLPYDDNGHGTHVSGIIAGNGYDSRGAHAGIAPAAHVVSLKVLDDRGRGRISRVIAALQWAVGHKAQYNIRVLNLSVGARITESYKTDPLTLAAKAAVDSGIVVVTAAGNIGSNAAGQPQYGGITAPGNAPWVLTVGASNTMGSPTRVDDIMAPYSSRGPSAIDYQAKPDVVAPGTGLVSLSDPTSYLYLSYPGYQVAGSLITSYKPYLSLSGTSMAAPVVAGAVALMVQANPSLTPNLTKAILQYTSQRYNYDALTQGAGFLNAKGAVQLARYFGGAKAGDQYPMGGHWSKQIIWGTHRLSGGVLKPSGNAWEVGVVWGAALGLRGDNIVWGTLCAATSCDNIVWGTMDDFDNIVWGTTADNIVWGTFRDANDNIVWGTIRGDDNIVWGTDCGGRDCDNIVWGTIREDNIVWGTVRDADNIVWGTARLGDNIVWGTSGLIDNIVWGTSTDGSVWGTSSGGVDVGDVSPDLTTYEDVDFDSLCEPAMTLVGGGL